MNSTIHPRLWSAAACHRFSFCPTPFTLSVEGPPSSPPNLRVRWLLRPGRSELCAKPHLALRYVPNSFALYLFADPHHLNPAVSIFYKKGGGGPPTFKIPSLELSSLSPATPSPSITLNSFFFTLLRTLWHAPKLNSFVFNRFRTLCPKKARGGGIPSLPQSATSAILES